MKLQQYKKMKNLSVVVFTQTQWRVMNPLGQCNFFPYLFSGSY
jgi:hypothetical protein